ncbi:MAG: TIR domain-containing protein [Pyrinomonadaceae bacterium]
MRECAKCRRCFADEVAVCPDDGAPTAVSLTGAPLLNNRYHLQSLLGTGPLGRVYLAQDENLIGREVAVRILDASAIDPAVFERLSTSVARVQGASVVEVTDFGDGPDGSHYLVMERVISPTLHRLIRRTGKLNLKRAVGILKQVADGLVAIHDAGIIHGAVNPDNIFVESKFTSLGEFGEEESVKLGDFGWSGVRTVEATTPGDDQGPDMISALAFSAPEQLQPDLPVDARADMYGLAAVAFYIISGRPPFSGDLMRLVVQKTMGEPPGLDKICPDLPDAVTELIMTGLNREAGARPPSITAWIAELESTVGVMASVGASLPQIVVKAPPGSRVFLDDEEQGQTDRTGVFTLLAAMRGVHLVRVQLPNGNESESLVEVSYSTGGQDLVVDAWTAQSAPNASVAEPSPTVEPALGRPTGELAMPVEEPVDQPADDVSFTVYRPEMIAPEQWYSMLAFAHLTNRPADAPAHEPPPAKIVAERAAAALGGDLSAFAARQQDSPTGIPRDGELTFKPHMKGIAFNPESVTFRWTEPVHQQEFRLRAPSELEGTTARGRLSVYLGSILLTEIPLAIPVGSTVGVQTPAQQPVSNSPRKVFVSYSHQDRAIVERVERCVNDSHLGLIYLRDATRLRAGQEWNPELMKMIDQADIFQLFWSWNSLKSTFVRQEYEYALSLGRRGFVRPVYWEDPFPEEPQSELPPEDLRKLHFENMANIFNTARPTGTLIPPGVSMAEPKPELSTPVAALAVEVPPAAEPRAGGERRADCPTCKQSIRASSKYCRFCGSQVATKPLEKEHLPMSAPEPVHESAMPLPSPRTPDFTDTLGSVGSAHFEVPRESIAPSALSDPLPAASIADPRQASAAPPMIPAVRPPVKTESSEAVNLPLSPAPEAPAEDKKAYLILVIIGLLILLLLGGIIGIGLYWFFYLRG